MKKKIILVAVLWAFGAVLTGSGSLQTLLFGHPFFENQNVQAEKAIESEINKTNQKKQSLQEEKKQLESDIAAIESKKDNVVEYIQTLDEKLNGLSEKIEKNQEESTAVKAQIKNLRKKKKQAQKQKESQYDTMSKRIKYIYENGNDGYLELLLESNSLSELFNRAEYVSKVTNYDRQMLKNYQEVCLQIEQSQKQLKEQLAELTSLKDSLKLEKDSVNLLVDKKTEQLNKYQTLVSNKSSEVASTNNLLQEQEDALEKLMAEQRRQAEAAEKAAQKKQEKNTQSNKANNSSNNTTNNNSTNNNTASNNTTSNNTVSKAGYGWPLAASGRISSYFGYRTAPTEGASTFHKGIDISIPTGTGVLATKAGTVVTSSYSSSAGNYIAVSHGNGVYSYYMHCSKLLVSAGSKVSKGQKIALSGNTGISTGPHLHFAIYANGAYVNPLNYVSQ